MTIRYYCPLCGSPVTKKCEYCGTEIRLIKTTDTIIITIPRADPNFAKIKKDMGKL